MRQFVEYIFRSCNSLGFLPNQFIDNDRVNLNQPSLYLADKDAEQLEYRFGEDGEKVFEDYIEKIVYSIITFGNINSHTVKDGKILDKIFRSAKSRFIIFGFAQQLLEIVV